MSTAAFDLLARQNASESCMGWDGGRVGKGAGDLWISKMWPAEPAANKMNCGNRTRVICLRASFLRHVWLITCDPHRSLVSWVKTSSKLYLLEFTITAKHKVRNLKLAQDLIQHSKTKLLSFWCKCWHQICYVLNCRTCVGKAWDNLHRNELT